MTHDIAFGAVSARACMTALALVCASPALAQTGEPADDQPESYADAILVNGRTEGYQVKATNTATKLPLTLRETPQSITVFTRQRIEDFNLITIAEVMEQTPGVTVQSYDSNRTRFQARGFSITNFQLDGVPSNFNVGASGNSVMSDTSVFERIEVVRGATGLVTGTGDPSATVNLVRKRPTDTLQANVSLSAGSWDYYRAEADVGGPLIASGRIRARVVGAYTDKQNFVRFQHDTSPSIYGVIEADITNTTRLRFGGDYLRTDSKGGAWSGVPLFFSNGTRTDLPRSYSGAARWNRWERDNINAFGVLEQEIGRWVARAAYNQRWTDTESLLFAGSSSTSGTITRFADATTGLGLNVSDTYTVGETREKSLDGYATGPLRLFGRDHDVVLGVNHYDREFRTIGASITARGYSNAAGSFPSIFTWNGDIPRPTTNNTGIPRSIEQGKQTGFYGSIRLNPSDFIKLILGARYTSYETATDNYNTAGVHTTTTGINSEKRVTPYIGLIVDLSKEISAFASYAEVFTPQSQHDVNDQQLAPLTGGNYEAGLKGEFFDKRLYVSVNGYHMVQSNVAELDPNSDGLPLPSGGQAYRSVSGVKTWGGEFEVSGSITPGWNVTGGYTYSRSKSANGDRFSPETPLHLVKFNSTYRLGQFVLGGGLSWQSRIYRFMPIPTGNFTTAGLPITQTGAVSQKGYALVDLLARFNLNDHLSAGLNLTNVLDKHYYRNVGFFNGGYYGQPRRVLANLRWKM